MWLVKIFYASINFIAWLYVSRLWKFTILLWAFAPFYKQSWNYKEWVKLWISIMCKLWRTIQKLYIKPFWAIVLMWVIRQVLTQTLVHPQKYISFLQLHGSLSSSKLWYFHLFSLIMKHKNKWKRKWNIVEFFWFKRSLLVNYVLGKWEIWAK